MLESSPAQRAELAGRRRNDSPATGGILCWSTLSAPSNRSRRKSRRRRVEGCRRLDRHHQGGWPPADRCGDQGSRRQAQVPRPHRGRAADSWPDRTLDLTEWDRVLNINVRANVILMKHFIPALRAAGGGSIVTVSSWYGRSGHGLFSAYCASKAALISLTHSAAAELARQDPRQFRGARKRRDLNAFQGAPRGGRQACGDLRGDEGSSGTRFRSAAPADPAEIACSDRVPCLSRRHLPHRRYDRRERRVHVHVTRLRTRGQSACARDRTHWRGGS